VARARGPPRERGRRLRRDDHGQPPRGHRRPRRGRDTGGGGGPLRARRGDGPHAGRARGRRRERRRGRRARPHARRPRPRLRRVPARPDGAPAPRPGPLVRQRRHLGLLRQHRVGHAVRLPARSHRERSLRPGVRGRPRAAGRDLLPRGRRHAPGPRRGRLGRREPPLPHAAPHRLREDAPGARHDRVRRRVGDGAEPADPVVPLRPQLRHARRGHGRERHAAPRDGGGASPSGASATSCAT
jgi:hypothetical protein